MKYYQNIIQPSKGYTHATTISCLPFSEDIHFANADSIEWCFSTGERYISTKKEGLSTTHIFTSRGIHNVTAVATINNDFSNIETYIATASCYIIDYVDNYITFLNVPPPTYAGFYTLYPYKIFFTCTQTETPEISLYSQYSRSYPPQTPPNKWSFIRPEWRFTDINGTVINSIKPSTSEIRIDGNGNISPTGTLVGLSGTAEFYYIDDIYNVDLFYSSDPSTIIWATLPTSSINFKLDSNTKNETLYSYSNSKIQAFAPYVSYWRLPDYLKITENGIQDFINPKWSTSPIPFLITSHIDDTQTNSLKLYRPDINFVKYIPYPANKDSNSISPIIIDTYINEAFNITFDKGTIPERGVYKFTEKDESGYLSPGYAFGSVTIEDVGFFQISAAATIDAATIGLPSINFYSPYVWIPNPAAGSISLVYYTGFTNPELVKELNTKFSTNYAFNINTPVVTNLNTTSLNLTGFNGIYSVAASPGQAPDYTYYGWVADADLDMLYKYSTDGTILTSVNLKKITNAEKVSPSNIVLDSQKNLWVTGYDTPYILKFNSAGELLTLIDSTVFLPQINPNIPGIFEHNSSNIFNDVNIVAPTCIDSDSEDNIWVSYSNPTSSYLIKYSPTGEHLNIVPLPEESSPTEILITPNNELWVVLSFQNNSKDSILTHLNSEGYYINNYVIPNLLQITFDLNERIWCTYEYNKLGYINNGEFMPIAEISSSFFEGINSPPLKSSNNDIQIAALEGIACSNKNLLFIVHSIDNKIYVFDINSNSIIDTIYIKPHLSKGFYNDINANKTENSLWNKSIQVIGDWTGLRWSLKYKDTNNFEQKTITGVSKTLLVKDCNDAEARKINQDFNMSDNLKDLALTSKLKSNTYLFDTFFSSVYGTSSSISDAGTVVYEKISNFLNNVRNIDTCEIDQLYDIANLLDTYIDDYRLSYPPQIKQIMNLLSITHSKLWGVRCNCVFNFKSQNTCTLSDICKICGKCKESNRGNKLDIKYIDANTSLVIYDKTTDNYFYHFTSAYNNQHRYSIDQLTAAGLKYPVEDHYDFYEYLSASNQISLENVIDWNNKYTTILPYQSSYNEWIKPGGIMDTMLSFYLYKGLGLLEGKNCMKEEVIYLTPTPTPSLTPAPPPPSMTPTVTPTLTPTITQLIIGEFIQIGQDIFGVTQSEHEAQTQRDNFGDSISLNSAGNILAVGSGSYNAYGNFEGRVQIFTLIDNIWTQRGESIFGPKNYQNFGRDVHINGEGNRLLINGSNRSVGALVYDWNGDAWVQTGQLPRYYFSLSLNREGNVIAGSNGRTIAGMTDPPPSGEVAVYVQVDSDWVQIGDTIQGPFDSLLGLFGLSNNINYIGNRVAVTNQGQKTTKSTSGEIHIFTYDSGLWEEQIISCPEPAGISFARQMAMSADGSTLVVYGIAAREVGSPHIIYTFKYIENSWVCVDSTLTLTSSAILVELSLSESGDVLVIGQRAHSSAPDNVSSNWAGKISIYKWAHYLGAWVQAPSIVGTIDQQRVGTLVKLNSAGNILAAHEGGSVLPEGYRSRVKLYRI